MAMEKLIKRNKNILQFGCFLFGVLIFIAVVSWYDGEKITFYNIKELQCKIVFLSDIHDCTVDTTIIAKEKPDLIAISGDIINSDCTDLSIATTLLERLTLIAPTYVSLENHELEYEERTGEDDTGAYKHGYELITEGSLENIDINIGCIVPFLDVIIKDKPDVPGLTLYYLIFLVNTVISYWVSSYKSFCVFTFYTQNYNA